MIPGTRAPPHHEDKTYPLATFDLLVLRVPNFILRRRVSAVSEDGHIGASWFETPRKMRGVEPRGAGRVKSTETLVFQPLTRPAPRQP